MPVRERRSFGNEITTADWEKLVLTSLKGAGTFEWGCLNKKGKLFRISTLKTVQVPLDVVCRLKDNGSIHLDNTEGYYVYTYRRKRQLFT